MVFNYNYYYSFQLIIDFYKEPFLQHCADEILNVCNLIQLIYTFQDLLNILTIERLLWHFKSFDNTLKIYST